MAEKICFLGRSGVGKSLLVSNIAAALTQQGKRVLQVGNDMSLSSTILVRGVNPVPVLDEFRKKYQITVEDYLIHCENGVYCLELGNIDPGAGCMARGLSIIDEMMEDQGLLDSYGIDYVLYDVAGSIPCTGYILPVREGIMDQCVLVTNSHFSSVWAVNSLMAAVIRGGDKHPPVRLLANQTDKYSMLDLVTDYARETGITMLECMEYYELLALSALEEKCLVAENPDSSAAKMIHKLARQLTDFKSTNEPVPFGNEQLMAWQKEFKLKRLQLQSGIIGAEYSMNI